MNVASESQVLFGWVFVILYTMLILYFVIRGAIKTKSMEDYAVGNLYFHPITVALSFAAATTSAATFIINPGFIALYGLSAFLSFGIAYPLTAMISFIILTKGFQKFGSTVKAGTMAQWVGKKYNSKFLEILFGILSLLLITFIVLILVGISQVFSKLLNLDIIYVLTFIVIFIFGYMMFGGANSMVYTNTIQAVIMIITAIIMLTSGINYIIEGNFFNKLKEIDPFLVQTTNPNSPLFRDYWEIFFFQIIVGVAILCQPHILTKSLLLKSDKDVNKYILYGVIVQIIFFLVVFTGFYARLTFPDLTINGQKLKMDEIIPTYLVVKFNVLITILLVFGVVSAGISTLEGLIQALSTTITVDLIKKIIPENKNVNYLLINRFVILILGIISWFLSYDQIKNPKLSVAIFAQAGVYGYFAANFIPVLFGTFVKNPNKIVVSISSILAILIHYWIFYVGKFPFISKYMLDESGNLLYVRNPGIAAAVAILITTILAIILQFFFQNKLKESEQSSS
jgi:sodium/pantothenate symporter